MTVVCGAQPCVMRRSTHTARDTLTDHLDVPVGDADAVGVSQGDDQLLEKLPRLGLRHALQLRKALRRHQQLNTNRKPERPCRMSRARGAGQCDEEDHAQTNCAVVDRLDAKWERHSSECISSYRGPSDGSTSCGAHPAGAALVHEQAQVASGRVLHGDGQVVRRQEHLLQAQTRGTVD